MSTLLSLVILVSSVIVTAVVMQMESAQAGLGTLEGSSDTSLWGSNKGSSKKEIQNKIVIVTSIVFAIALLALAFLQ